MSLDLLSTAFFRVLLVLFLSSAVLTTGRSQTTIASQDFDTPFNLNNQMINPDGSNFMSFGDIFNVTDRTGSGNPATGLPFVVADDSVNGTCRSNGTYTPDNAGFITCNYPDGNFFAIADVENGDNTNPGGMGYVDMEFQIDNATDLVVSIDMAAMGNFESSDDIYNWSYSFDNVSFTPLFTSSVNESGSQNYTMESGLVVNLTDPVVVNGTTLNDNFQTISGALTGTGAILYLRLEASSNGSDEAFAFDNVVVTGTATNSIVISEFEPNPPGTDPSTVSFEIAGGTPGTPFDLWVLGIESDGFDGTIDRATNITGTFDANGLAVVLIPDLENPSFTAVLLDNFTGSIGDDIDPNNNGMGLDLSTFGTVLDAIGIPDASGDAATQYGALLGGQDFAYTGDEPGLVFREASTGDWYAVNDPANGEVFDINAVDVTPAVFESDPTAGTTFGAINPALGSIDCSITNVVITEQPVCGDMPFQDDSYFELTFDVANGSGDYIILNPANNTSYHFELNAATDGTILSGGQANAAATEGSTANVVVVDQMNSACRSTPVSITLPFCPPIVCPDVDDAFISEFHYDNTGGDENEFIEIAIANDFDGDVDNLVLTLYNGSNGSVYGSFDFSDFTEGDDDGIFTYYTLVTAVNGIQNGSPDGLALSCDDMPLEFLSYEGDFMAQAGPAQGMTSTDIGVSEPGSAPLNSSLQLIDGVWTLTCQNTFGTTNEDVSCCDIVFDDFTIVDESCAGEGDGSITVTASCVSCDGILYSFDGGETFGTENTISGLVEDCYTVVIQAIGVEDCEVSRVLIVENDNPTVIPQIEELSFVREAMIELAGAEIVAYIPDNNTAAVTSGDGLQLVDLSDPTAPSLLTTITPTSLGFSSDEVSSTAYSNGILAAAVPNDDTQMPGDILFFDASGTFINSITVGALPDMVKFSPDGSKLLVANEGEPNSDYTIDPEGTISIIDLSGGAGAATTTTADFTAFNASQATLQAQGVRIFGPGATVAQDLEPEYITITDDGATAYVTLQENNAFAVVDIASSTVTEIRALGLKAYCEPGNDIDASNQDDGINIKNWPAVGMYQPDGIECYTANGQMYIVSANEGDARDYDGFSEENRADDLNLDEAAYPDAADLQQNENLGRLTITTTEGDLDGDGDYDQITSFGARSFSIWNATTGDLVFDSGSDLANISALITPTFFNANDGDEGEFDNRSDDKGIEPEGIAIKEIGGSVYAFVIFERAAGGFAVYNITDPVAPYFVTYVPGADVGDIAPESIVVVDPNNNPTDGFLVLLASEDSGTLSTFSVTDNKETGIIPVTVLANGGSGVYTAYSATITGGTAAGEVSLYDGDTENPILDATQVTEPGTVILETQVTDENGCVTIVTETIFVVPALERDIAISDPCSCLDNATVLDFDNNTGGDDGQFSEQVAITGLDGTALPTGLDFRVVSITGGTDANNVPMVGTQSDGTPFAGEEPLIYDPVTGYYTIDFVFIENQGYTITVEQFVAGNATGGTFTIGNNCAYPNPVFDPILDAIYCNFETATTLGADDLEGLGADAINFTINGQAATEFDPVALGAGIHTVVLTYDGAADANGGISPDGGTVPAFPGCTQTAQVVVEVESLDVGCIADLNVTLGEACTAIITPEMVLTGSFTCADEIIVTVDGGNSNAITGCGAHTFSVDVFVAGELVYTCWGDIFAEDKTDPVVECPADVDEAMVTFELQTLEGSIDGTEETLALADYSCFQNFFDPIAGTDYSYDLITFTVSETDVYNFLVDSDVASTVITLFNGDFNETNPCENVLGGSDGAYAIVDFFGIQFASFFNQNLRVPLMLEAGSTYTLMVANDGTPTDYTVGVVSDNGNAVSAVGLSTPQPVDILVPFYCEDVDLIRFQTPQHWIADANGVLDFTATRNTFFGGSTAALNAFLEKLGMTGLPVVGDNCGPVLVTLSDVLTESGDCGDITLTRTFTVADRYDGACVGTPRTVDCDQVITFSRPSLISDVFGTDPSLVLPPFTGIIECDEAFETDGSIGGPDDNPTAQAAGQPFILTVSGYVSLDQVFCNIGASYSDEPRIDICEGSYSFRREWNFIDWCAPAENFIFQQYVKVGDFTGPVISGIPTVINV
ncbi:MAG: choice-of-anchor I family protein, partial [Lewinella sp.]|uniref:choice-of-anchor I family protein n=1 Tax=Lewinella sp. TaxID=2004506 RepID=UPI003D6C5065